MAEVLREMLKFLKCIYCDSNLEYNKKIKSLHCINCKRNFPMFRGIPSLIKDGAEPLDMRGWDSKRIKKVGMGYHKRATGELAEKESSKSYARLIKENYYEKGDKILDIGCASGHLLRSLRRIIDPKIKYTGIDITKEYLKWGEEVFGINELNNFVHCSATNLPFKDNSYDTVIVNLFHFFPRIDIALKEVIRVAKKRVIWRALLSNKANYVIKEIYDTSFKKTGVITPEKEDFDYCLYMIYSKEYIQELIKDLGGRVTLIKKDEDFSNFDNTKLNEFDSMVSTRVVNNMQIHDSIILNWQYVVIEKTE